jgi:hypothetical protein
VSRENVPIGIDNFFADLPLASFSPAKFRFRIA